LLPTILFILGAYGLYALVLVWCQWQRSRWTGRRRQGRPRWLTLTGGAIFLGIFLGLTSWLAPSNSDQKLKLAGILGVSESEVDLAKQASLRAATLRLEPKPPQGEPAYTLLHPESPPSLLPPAKSSLGAVPLHKPKVKRAGKDTPKPRVEASLSKKDKAAAGKARPKKKKVPQPTTMNSPGSGNGNG
jgi:hypothetical protein